MKRIPLEEISIQFDRSSGPGGQNVNKVNTKATLKWNIESTNSLPSEVKARFRVKYMNRISGSGDVIVQCDSYRSQNRNKEACIKRLYEMVTSVWRPPKKRRKTKPKRSAIEKRLKEKKRQSERKQTRKSIKY